MIRISNVNRYPFYEFTDTETGIQIPLVTAFTINTPEPGDPTTATITVIAEVDVIVDAGEIKSE